MSIAVAAAMLVAPIAAGASRGDAARALHAPAPATVLPGGPIGGTFVDDAHGHELISESGALVVLDTSGAIAHTVANQTNAGGIAVIGNVVYLMRANPSGGGGTLATFNATTLASITSYSLPAAFDSDGSIAISGSVLWLGNGFQGKPLYSFDPTAHTFTGYSLGAFDFCGSVIAIPSSSLLACYGQFLPQTLVEVDVGGASPAVVASAAVPRGPVESMVGSPGGSTLYVATADGITADATSDLAAQGSPLLITRENVAHSTGLAATTTHSGLLAVGSLDGEGPGLYVFSFASDTPVHVASIGELVEKVIGFSADGTKLYVVDYDAGNISFAVVTDFTVPTVPAAPTLFAHPPAVDIDPNPTFFFRDTMAGVTFRCSLDGATQVDCSRGLPYFDLPDGPHHLAVVAEYGAANDSVPTTFAWTVKRSGKIELDPWGGSAVSLGPWPILHTTPFSMVVVNRGTASMHVLDVTVSGPGAGAIKVTNQCVGAGGPIAIAPDHVCRMDILLRPLAFAPTSASITITTDALVPKASQPLSWSGDDGYWIAAASDVVVPLGNAYLFGPAAPQPLHAPVIDIERDPDPSTSGYWTLASDGGLFSYGYRVPFYGSTGAMRLNRPVVGMAATPSGHGYWMVASDGGIFSFGDAHFYGSTGSIRLNQPIVGMSAAPSGHGYLFVARDGGIFNYGDAGFHGSTGGLAIPAPIVDIQETPTGRGYWLLGGDGTVYHFGDAPDYGSLPPAESWVALAGSE